MAIQSKNKTIFDAKQEVVANLKKNIESAVGMVVLDYRGLTVAQDTELRNEYRKSGVKYMVVRNRMMKLALNQLGYTDFDESLNGTTAIAFSSDDVVAPAKITADAIKKYNKMQIKSGLADGKFMNAQEVQALSSIPSKEVLIGQLLGLLTNPMRSLAVVLNEHAKQMA